MRHGSQAALLGGTPAATRELVILAAVVGVASVVLAEAHAWMMRLPPARPTDQGRGLPRWR